MNSEPGVSEPMSRSNKLTILLLFTGVLMGALDISIVGPAIPSIESSISIEPRLLGWIFSIYVLFNLMGISLFARLSDIFGRRSIYIVSLTIFAAGSLVVSISSNFNILLAGRAIQGFGASGIFPVASAVVGDLFDKARRGRVLGLLGAVFGFAFIIGPVIAGILLRYFEWHALFLINIPVAIILVAGSLRILPGKVVGSKGKLDSMGIIIVGLMLGAFAFGINNIESTSFLESLGSPRVYPFLIASFILAPILFMVEKRESQPIIKTSLFLNRQVRIVGIIAVATGLLQSTFVFIPNFAVGSFGVSPSSASFMLLPIVIATAVGSPLFGRLIDTLGSKKVILAGLTLSIVGFYMMNLVVDSKLFFYSSGALIGLGLSVLAGSSLRYILLNEASVEERAVTQGMLTIFISLGQLTGAALVGVAIASSTGTEGYRSVFLYLAFILVAVLLQSLRLKSREAERQ